VWVMGGWQRPGQQSSIQQYAENFRSPAAKAYSNAQASDASTSDASFIRLKNVSLSYELENKWLKKVSLSSVRIFLEGQNLLTRTKFLGMDPENQNAQILPPLRVLAAGIHIGL
ncbi:MAG TPA: hypothetical protein VNS32_00375, partial [Flavisolibacter sp.]|nr:hypothetical protein [Flavisolibacter sp.]